MITCTQVYTLTSWAQMLLCSGPWEGGQPSGRSSMTPGGWTVSQRGCEELNADDCRLWILSFYLTTACFNPLSAYVLLSSRACVYSDPADPWQCRKERWQTLLLLSWEEFRNPRWGEPHSFCQGGKSVSGELNPAVHEIIRKSETSTHHEHECL